MGFSRQEHWSGEPFPSPGDLPNPGTEPRSPALHMDSLPAEPPRKHSNWKGCKTECESSFWSLKFIKTVKKQERSWQELSPPPTTWKTEVWGMGTCPRGQSSLKFHPAGEEGQPGPGGASSGRPGPSRASSALARVLDRRLPEGVEVPGLSPIIQMGTCPGLRGLCRSSTGCFWAHFIFTPLAGQPTAKKFNNTSPDSPSHLLLLLGEARGSDWGHSLGLHEGAGLGVIAFTSG